MNTDLFIETNFSLSPKDILDNTFHAITIPACENKTHPEINCWTENSADESESVLVSVGDREPQTIPLVFQEITFGKRAFFKCPACEITVSKIFLPHNAKEFKCRKCYKLQYQLSSFNRYSVAGRKLYQLNRIQKLSNNRASMSRILYHGQFTKRFSRFVNLCDRAGLSDVVRSANVLKSFISSENYNEARIS